MAACTGNDDALNPFRFFDFRYRSIDQPIGTVIDKCLTVIQEDISKVECGKEVVSSIVISALASVGAWPNGKTREQIIDIGSRHWSGEITLEKFWNKEHRAQSILPCLPEMEQHRFASTIPSPPEFSTIESFDLLKPRDGPKEVYSPSMHHYAGRRCVLSYVHDKACDHGQRSEDEVVFSEGRRSVRLTGKEVAQVSKPAFFNNEYSKGIFNLWHDGMKYPSPDGEWNSYAGVVPYMLPGSAVWHLVPRLRDSSERSGYPSTRFEKYDNIIYSFSQLRNSGQLSSINDVTVLPATDKPYRDLSGVRRLWMMAEAACGMLKDHLVISVQDMAGIALTLMHYDKIIEEMICVIKRRDESSTIARKRGLLSKCFPSPPVIKWAELCKNGEGARAVMEQTLANTGCENNSDDFIDAVGLFMQEVSLLSFWYALLLAPGQIKDLTNLRMEVLEDLAVAPAWDEEDRAKVYFMVEASLVNRMERSIPYEESIRRFLRAGDTGGKLLLQSVNLRSKRIEMEITRQQIAVIVARNWAAAFRQPGWDLSENVLMSSWLEGQRGPYYVGRFTTSASKPLYIKAAQAWAGMTERDIVTEATEGKKRMVVLLTDEYRLFRKIDVKSGTTVIMCSVFFMDEDQHNRALSIFGTDHCHAEKRCFRGNAMRWDAAGNAMDWANRRDALCVVGHKRGFFEIAHPERVYQIVVTVGVGQDQYGRLAGIRHVIHAVGQREPAAVSYSDVLSHVCGDKQGTLLTLRADQLSPDGVNIVDYSFEYDMFWVDGQGRMRTNAESDDTSTSKTVHGLVAFLREKDWDNV